MSRSENPSIATAAESGDYLGLLKALRAKVAAGLDSSTSARDIATLSRRLTELMAEIADLEKPRAGAKEKAASSGDEDF